MMENNVWEAELTSYQRWKQDCSLKGLDPESIERSRTRLSHSVNGTQYLKKEAFLPTGLALGCPLEDRELTGGLAELSIQAATYLSRISKSCGPSFAFVPPDSYHITVLNRTYFESSSEIFPLSEKELKSAEETVQKLGIGKIIIVARSALLTSSGKILVPGYPNSGDLDKLRREVGGSVQTVEDGKLVHTLYKNVPKGATIKLGHVLVALAERELGLFLEWLDEAGQNINGQLVFTELYTQIRRIPL